MHNYKAVIFDFNGTLFFDNDKHVKAWGTISNMIRGHDISVEELHTHMNGVPNMQIVQYMLGKETSEDILNQYSRMKESYYRKFCKEDQDTFHLVKGAEDYFDFLKEMKIPFTIASASIKENIDFFVESFHLDKWMKPENIIYDDGTYKNKIKMFQDAASILNVDMKDTLVIEDSISGIKNAYAAGCRNIVVVDSAGKQEDYKDLPGVKKILKDFSDII